MSLKRDNSVVIFNSLVVKMYAIEKKNFRFFISVEHIIIDISVANSDR